MRSPNFIKVYVYRGIYYLCILLLCSSAFSMSSVEYYSTDIFSIQQGLSQTRVNALLQDSKGFIWVGTQDGLNRFDGVEFVKYQHNPLDSTTLSNNYIRALAEDKYGNIWVGTNNGLNKFEPSTGKFYRYYHNDNNSGSLSDNYIYYLFCDSKGILWVKTLETLEKLDHQNNNFQHYYHFNKISNFASGDSYFSIFEDHTGVLWIGTLDGLNAFDPVKELFTRFSNSSDPYSISSNRIKSICEDKNGKLWVGTEDGLNRFDRQSQKFTRYFYNPVDINSIPNNSINTLFSSNNGELWVGTNQGLGIYNEKMDAFKRIVKVEYLNLKYSLTLVSSIIQDQSSIIWVGTLQGMVKFDVLGKKFKLYRNSENENSFQISSNYMGGLLKDAQGNIWAGTWGSGLNKINTKNGNITIYRTENRLTSSGKLSDDFIYSLYLGRDQKVWIGTRSGLDIYNPVNNKILKLCEVYPKINCDVFKENRIFNIENDHKDQIWIATANGIYSFNPKKNEIIEYHGFKNKNDEVRFKTVYKIICDSINGEYWIGTDIGLIGFKQNGELIKHYNKKNNRDFNSLSSNAIYSMLLDSKGLIWLGTATGLNRFDRTKLTFKLYTIKDGLPNNLIYSIQEDKKGNLWMATNWGITKFNPSLETFSNFDVGDGLQNNEFNLASSYKSSDGEMFFGGINGFNSFYPDSLKFNNHKPPVVITSFSFYDNNGSNELSVYGKSIVEIPPRTDMFILRFTALDFTNPEKNQYKYKLQKEDKEGKWIDLGNTHQAMFSNLPPGKYVFSVMGSNNDLVWSSEPATLEIHVIASIWESRSAYLLYAFILGILIYAIIATRSQNVSQLRRHLKEKEVIGKELQMQKELMALKNKSITDSINYAKRIQEAMMPSENYFKKVLPESFIFHRPKDIVSGDFYWITENANKIFVSAVDCTGHGVPGAFMSIIGFELFRKITYGQGIEDPSRILNTLNSDFAEIFKDVENMTLRDGMDIAFCVIDKASNTLEFSGAFNPLYIVRDNQILEFKGDRFSIGIDDSLEQEQIFMKHTIKLEPEDMMYIFTDGFADQFGGSEGKKFKYRRFRHLLLSINKLSLLEQKEYLSHAIDEWRKAGNFDQVDDILIIGIKPYSALI